MKNKVCGQHHRLDFETEPPGTQSGILNAQTDGEEVSPKT
jgi:hypothetical protein